MKFFPKPLEGLKRLRKLRGLTQVMLADLSGISQGSLSEYESGKVKPYPHVVQRLAQVLNCAEADLYERRVA